MARFKKHNSNLILSDPCLSEIRSSARLLVNDDHTDLAPMPSFFRIPLPYYSIK